MSHFNTTIDEITFKAACANKTYAQKKIYDLFANCVYNLVYRITQNQTDSLDISQDVFITIFNKVSQSKSPELFGFWVRKIAINTTLSFIKKNARLITNINFKEKSHEHDINETLSSLDFALNKLSQTPRTILWLYEVEGMSHQEIANFYGKSISFSKTHLSRAKALAQSYLTSQEGGYKAIK